MPTSSTAPTLPPLFAERQDFWRTWWWLALLVPALLSGLFFLGLHPLPASPAVKWLVLLVPTALTLGTFALLRLETHLDIEGISYRFLPLGWKRVLWAEVQRAYVRAYAPLGEYGGWGIRRQSATSAAYIVTGSQGLQLELTTGRKVLLGTQQPEALRRVLAELGQQ